jgi:hypothetical protein
LHLHNRTGSGKLKAGSSEKKGSNNEGPGISKEDLREVQGDYTPWCGARHLRERKA